MDADKFIQNISQRFYNIEMKKREAFTHKILDEHLTKWHKLVKDYAPQWFRRWSFRGHIEIIVTNDDTSYFAVEVYGTRYLLTPLTNNEDEKNTF